MPRARDSRVLLREREDTVSFRFLSEVVDAGAHACKGVSPAERGIVARTPGYRASPIESCTRQPPPGHSSRRINDSRAGSASAHDAAQLGEPSRHVALVAVLGGRVVRRAVQFVGQVLLL